MYSPKGNFGASSMFETWNPSLTGTKKELTRTTTLDEIVGWLRIDRITAVKLDIEGAEFEALDGFQHTLNHLRPFVIFEWRPDVFAKSGLQVRDITASFPTGYSFRLIGVRVEDQQARVILEPFDPNIPSENVLALPTQSPEIFSSPVSLAGHSGNHGMGA
jgi:hypothetical protein